MSLSHSYIERLVAKAKDSQAFTQLHEYTYQKFYFVSWGYRIVHNVSLRMLEKRRELPSFLSTIKT